MSSRKLPAWVTVPLAVGAFGLLFWLERRRSLRRPVEPGPAREARNLAVAVAGAAALQLVERPLVAWCAALVERRRVGLLARFGLPVWLETALAVALLDYSLFVWHVLTHKLPVLWRFHVVHHADRDLSVTTAVRFHFGELAISAAWRAVQVLAIGVTPLALSVWQSLLFVSVLFHHSNVRLPEELERRLGLFVVTPRMHGIHHSIVADETDSNWSSGLAIWDRLHGTLRLDVAQDGITIGAPGYDDEDGLGRALALPFHLP